MRKDGPMICGKMIRLRNIEEHDLEAVLAVNEDPVVRANVVGWAWPNSLADQRKWFEEQSSGATHRWVVLDDADRVLGLTGLWDVDMQNRHALTALKLGGANTPRGRGLGTDAIKTVMAFAFYDVGLVRLYGSIIDFNEASMRAYCGKCGWSLEGTARRHVWRHGEFHDLHQVGILKDEFDRLDDASFYVDRINNGR